jgi:hypothetical protein
MIQELKKYKPFLKVDFCRIRDDDIAAVKTFALDFRLTTILCGLLDICFLFSIWLFIANRPTEVYEYV